MTKVDYDLGHPILLKDKKYLRYAREHMAISQIKSDVIDWEVIKTNTALRIPIQYHVHYRIKSIVGIDEQQDPIFGMHHTLDISLPPRYPLVPCNINMITPVWHPNIKWDGNYQGRICGNVKNFGRAYELYQLVLRIGEILQYKNYHAEHIPPYPEDAKVAEWVLEYAEPNGIISNVKGIAIDDTPLLRNDETPAIPPSEPSDGPKIKIKAKRQKDYKRSKLVIKLGDKRSNPDQ